jgi:hypothetical protein
VLLLYVRETPTGERRAATVEAHVQGNRVLSSYIREIPTGERRAATVEEKEIPIKERRAATMEEPRTREQEAVIVRG